MADSNSSASGIGFTGLVTIFFIGLKLAGIITIETHRPVPLLYSNS